MEDFSKKEKDTQDKKGKKENKSTIIDFNIIQLDLYSFLMFTSLTILLIIIFSLWMYSIIPSYTQYHLNTAIIQSSDDLLDLMEDEKYIEASYLAKSINDKWVFLRENYDKSFYVDIEEKYFFHYITMSEDLNVLNNCSKNNISEERCDYFKEEIVDSVKSIQSDICEKSYYSEKILMEGKGLNDEKPQELCNQSDCETRCD